MKKLLLFAPVLTVFLAKPLGCAPETKIPPPEQGNVIGVEENPTIPKDTITVLWPDGKTTLPRVDRGECPLKSQYPKCVGEK